MCRESLIDLNLFRKRFSFFWKRDFDHYLGVHFVTADIAPCQIQCTPGNRFGPSIATMPMELTFGVGLTTILISSFGEKRQCGVVKR